MKEKQGKIKERENRERAKKKKNTINDLKKQSNEM